LFATGFLPTARAARVEPYTESEHRTNPGFNGTIDDAIELVQLLDDDHHSLAGLRADTREVYKAVVFEPVADEKRVRRLIERDGREELGLAADFKTIVVFSCFLQISLDNLAALVNLHRKHGKMFAAVLE